MKKGRKINHLGRKSSECKALLKSLSIALIKHKQIVTTLAKAKALRHFIEPLFTRAKDDSMNSQRHVFSILQNNAACKELFSDIARTICNRHGGYTRIIKTGHRNGDNAKMCIIELVDYNKDYTKE